MTVLTKRITRVLVFVTVFALPAVLSAEVTCPPTTPSPGSTVNGGLDVVGQCIVDHVTVNGGITVESGGHLQLTNSLVNGGIVDLPCGELDVDASTNGGGFPIAGATDTINGGIDLEAGAVCPAGAFSNADIYTAQINGGISMTGTYAVGDVPVICANTIKGNMEVNNVTAANIGTFEATIGDPDSMDGRGPCGGNIITGAFIFNNSSVFAVESNTIGGSALLTGNNTLEFNGNAIGGSLKCSTGTVIVPGEPGDPSGNTVHGSTHCGP